MSSSAQRERTKARRRQLREIAGDSADTDGSREDLVQDDEDEVDEEAQNLEKKLKQRHRRTQRQLDRTLQNKEEEEEDPNQQLRTAQKRTKERVLEEKAKSAGEESDGEASHVTRDSDSVAADDGGVAMDTTPPGTSRSVVSTPRRGSSTPRALNISSTQAMRQRLLDRKLAAKEKAKDETYKDGSMRRLAGMRSMTRSTRFDDDEPIGLEDTTIEQQLEKSLNRSRWKKTAGKVIEGQESSDLPTESECFDFFTKQFEPEPEPEKEEEEEEAGEEAAPREEEEGAAAAAAAEEEEGAEEATEADAEEGEAGTSGKKKKKKAKKEDEEPLLEDDLEEAEGWKYVHFNSADYKPFRKKLEDEQKVTFYPSIIEAPLEKKMFGREHPRYLDEEGFYVGVRPLVPNRNVHRMENRLLEEGTEGAQKWFGEDGRLIALPDPLKEVPSRPHIVEEVAPQLQTEFVNPVVQEFDSRFIDGSVTAQGHYQLDVDINRVRLQHHHCFSREHVLAARLTDQYTQYMNRARRKAAEYLSEKLTVLRGAAAHTEEVMAAIKSKRRAGAAEQQGKLVGYRAEIRSTRKMRDGELAADHTLLKHMLQTWKDVKSLRSFQGCVNTSIKLQLRKETANKAEDEEEWEREIREEVKEMKEDLKEEHDKAMDEYHKELDKWKKQKLDKKAAAKRQRQRERNRHRRQERQQRREENEDEDDDDEDAAFDPEDEKQEDADIKILEDIDMEKPEKPKFVEDAEARAKIVAKFEEIRRKPGQPKLFPELSNSTAITNSKDCPRGEQNRRSDVNRYKLYCEVLFNGKEVSRTPSKPLGQDFMVQFAQIFNIEIVQWPESIKIEVHETTGLSNTMLSEVYLLIPDANVTTETTLLEDMEFSSEHRVSHSHEGVGSGVEFSFEASGGNKMSLMTTGILTTSVAWALDQFGNVLVPPSASTGNQLYNAMKGMDAVAGIGMSGMADMDKLTKWIAETKLDPNDPNNTDLMHLMKPAGGGDAAIQGLRMPDHFRLEQLQEEFDFCTDKELEESKRFRLIRLREQEVAEFKSKVIPAFDREISESTFDEYEKRMKSHEKLKGMDEMESHRIAVAKFMQKVREQIMLRFRLASHQKTLQEMVDEEVLPNITVFIPQLMKLFEPSRPLRPKRKERKKVTPQNLQGPDAVKVMVNVVRAFDIPVRLEAVQGSGPSAAPSGISARGTTSGTGTWSGAQGMVGTGGGTGAGGPVKNIAGETMVRPFIEVMFQRNTAQTSVADGPNPSWNEDLHIPFRPYGLLDWDQSEEDLYSLQHSDGAPSGDYSPANLENCNDMLYLNLFDEYIVDMPAHPNAHMLTDQERGTNIHRRIEKKFLGSLKIPFSTVYLNSTIDGTFRIRKPPVLLGYTHEHGNRGVDTGIQDVAAAIMGDHTYVTLFITIEPPLTIAEPMKEKFDSNEDDKLLQDADLWQDQLYLKFPKRVYKTTVVDINAKSVFLTRYLKALKPPDELLVAETPEAQAEKVARFVSLIPFISDNVIFPGICDIWSTCDQFLQMLQGDEEEHAVMLANYFLYLGKPTWLLLGNAIPEGQTSYVLTKEKNGEWRLWNPSTGEHFSQRDNYCPVTSVGCLANAENIWANIQPNGQPSRIQFDFSNEKHWTPFFNKSNPQLGLGSVQPEALIYKETDKQYVIELQEKIEQRLKEKLMSWRPRYITRWNRYCMQAFRRLLVRLEDSHGSEVQAEHAAELDQVLGSYKLCGFPINLPYTEMTPLIDSVYATGVHNQEAGDIEFALAVHIHPYPNNVLSVWIYVASLVRKR